MKLKVYANLFREQSEYLYRIAFFYLGDEQPALEAVRTAACEGFRRIRDLDDGQSFKLQITRGLLAESTINQKPTDISPPCISVICRRWRLGRSLTPWIFRRAL